MVFSSFGSVSAFFSRLQIASLLCLYQWMILGWPFVGTFLFVYIIFHRSLWPFGLLYSFWHFFGFNTPRIGSRPIQWIRNLSLWTKIADYFPVEVIKTAELPADRNYLIALVFDYAQHLSNTNHADPKSAHPHGIFGTSSALIFGTNGTAFQRLFPGIQCRVATLSLNFLFPFRRDFLIAMGAISSDANSIGYVLDLPPAGNAVGIVPGGVAEISLTRPGEHKLILKNRKGFVKLAIKHGADLVPIYHFGEQDLLIPVKLSKFLDKFQAKMKILKGGFIPLAYGLSFLSVILPEKLSQRLPSLLRYGIIPFKRRIVSVVGAPIRVRNNPNPSQGEIDGLHKEYCEKLRELFETHKFQMGGLPESAQLQFV